VRRSLWRWPAWAMSLSLSALVGVTTVNFNVEAPADALTLPSALIMPIIISKGQELFPELASFMSGWFHQDFDIHGETLEEVVAAFKADSGAELLAPLIADIDAFLATGDDDMEE